MRRCVAYIHDPDTMLTFNLKVNRPHVFFVLWHTIFGTWMYHNGMMCHIHSWRWPLFSISKLYFHHYIFAMNFSLDKVFFALSPWDMLCTFMTSVWPWPLAYILVNRGIPFYSQFLFNNLSRPLLGDHYYSLRLCETRLRVKKKIFKEIPQLIPFYQIKVPALGVGRSWNLRFFSLPYWCNIPIW